MDAIQWLVQAPLNCILWLIVGAVAGALAGRLMNSPQPLIVDIILGLLGAVVGGFIAGTLFQASFPAGGLELVLVNLVVATIGAIIIIGLGRLISGRRPT
jgi:uncharacterized membrane protein YeaQ/YmgE (transglycosylase-associated protein family)